MADVLVIGGGICGLGTALLLARDGHGVTLVDRDPLAPPAAPGDCWEHWARQGIAQFRQPHNLMPGMRVMLEAELPDVQAALCAAGATRLDMLHPNPFGELTAAAIDDQLWTFTARRPIAEWVFARAAMQEPGIDLRRGVRIDGLTSSPGSKGSPPTVTGARSDAGEAFAADLVVDATGRGSRAPAWLQQVGAMAPVEAASDCGFTYFTRYFHGRIPQRRSGVMTGFGTFSILTLPGDNDTWSVTIFCSSTDRDLRGLRDPDRWRRVVAACPLHAHWLDGEAISEVLVMGGVVDRRRSFVVDGQPVAGGFVPVADAWACTNPSAGRGITVGFRHALCLRDELRHGLEDPHAFAARFLAATERELAPWYDAQIAADRHRFAEIEALRAGRTPAPPEGLFALIAPLFATMSRDPELFRAGLEYVATLTPVQQILARDGIAERIDAASARLRQSPRDPLPGPGRAELLALVA